MSSQFDKRKYYYGLGRRKQATARVRIYPDGKGVFIINNKPALEYLNYKQLHDLALQPLAVLEQQDQYDISVIVKGGGCKGQTEAVRLGLAKALLQVDEEWRQPLKAAGLLTTDSRVKERKKYGLRKARKAPQYTKR